MRQKFAVAVLVLGMITFVSRGALAQTPRETVRSAKPFAEGSHLDKAIANIEAAIREGGESKFAAQIDVHLTEAREHAMASKAEKANPHLDAALKEINGALVEVAARHPDAAVKRAKEALTHLEAAK